ncbi:MAG: DRTGG domain-containing protein [Candidatus Eisenbacteria bacterium]
MRRLVIGSTRADAGKTSLILGLGRAAGGSSGYAKPFGDRLLYRKKRLWDYDAALVAEVFGLGEDPKDMSIGFDHSKLRFMYDAEGVRQRLEELASSAGSGKDVLFIEAGSDLTYGASVNLDAVSVARGTGAGLVIVLAGEDRAVLDDMAYLRRHLDVEGAAFEGVIVNKLQDVEDFRNSYGGEIAELGVRVLGMIPLDPELTYPSVGYISECLFAKVVTGEDALDSVVKHIFVGAMAAGAARRLPAFASSGKLVITSGDRSDMVLAALESDTAGIVLTNGIAPPSSIISKAAERNVPLLLAPEDTFKVAKLIDDASKLLRHNEKDKIERIGALVRDYVDTAALLG